MLWRCLVPLPDNPDKSVDDLPDKSIRGILTEHVLKPSEVQRPPLVAVTEPEPSWAGNMGHDLGGKDGQAGVTILSYVTPPVTGFTPVGLVAVSPIRR